MNSKSVDALRSALNKARVVEYNKAINDVLVKIGDKLSDSDRADIVRLRRV